MKRFFAVLTFVALAFSSCKKEVGENKKLDPKDQKKYDLMTDRPGSWWMYGGSDSTVTILSATGRDSTVKDLFFSYYERVDTTSAEKNIMPEFFGKNADRYIFLQDLDGTFSKWIIVIFYKDGVQKNEKWVNIDEVDYLGLKFQVKVESAIKETGGVMTINAKTYTDVITIHHDFLGRLNLGGIDSDYSGLGYLDVWFVKGIGIIKKDLNITITAGDFTKQYTDSLLDYHFETE